MLVNKASPLLDLWLFAIRRYVERMGDFMRRVPEGMQGGLCAEACFEVAGICEHGCGYGTGGGESLHWRVEAEPIDEQNARRDEG
jgi:hypothetical protein